jgi:hypothetical protein
VYVKKLEDFDGWIKYDDTEHMEITLNYADWLEDYLRQQIQVVQHMLEKGQERERRGDLCDYYSEVDSINALNRILELIRRQQKIVSIDDLNGLYSELITSFAMLRTDNPSFLDDKRLKTMGYILNSIERQVQNFGNDRCRAYIDYESSLPRPCDTIRTAKAYQNNQAHITFSRLWLGKYITAIGLDNVDPARWETEPGFEGFPDSPKISGFVEESEDDYRIPHLVLPGEWTEKLTFIKTKREVASSKNER